MYCPQCGTANDDAASFCTKCGMDLQNYREQWAAAPARPPVTRRQVSSRTGPRSRTAPSAARGSARGLPPPYQQQYQPTYQTTPATSRRPISPPATSPATGRSPTSPATWRWAIVTLILCFWPTGIVAVVYASKVGNRLALGDVPGAQEASRKAKMWCWITFGIAVAGVVIAIIGVVIAAVASHQHHGAVAAILRPRRRVGAAAAAPGGVAESG